MKTFSSFFVRGICCFCIPSDGDFVNCIWNFHNLSMGKCPILLWLALSQPLFCLTVAPSVLWAIVHLMLDFLPQVLDFKQAQPILYFFALKAETKGSKDAKSGTRKLETLAGWACCERPEFWSIGSQWSRTMPSQPLSSSSPCSLSHAEGKIFRCHNWLAPLKKKPPFLLHAGISMENSCGRMTMQNGKGGIWGWTTTETETVKERYPKSWRSGKQWLKHAPKLCKRLEVELFRKPLFHLCLLSTLGIENWTHEIWHSIALTVSEIFLFPSEQSQQISFICSGDFLLIASPKLMSILTKQKIEVTLKFITELIDAVKLTRKSDSSWETT